MPIRTSKNKTEAKFEHWAIEHCFATFRAQRGTPTILQGKMCAIIPRAQLNVTRAELSIPIEAVAWFDNTIIIAPK